MLGKEPDFLQSDGTDHVCDNTVSSVSWSFPGLELNVNELQARIGSLRQEYSTKLFRYQGSLGSEGLQGEVRNALSRGFASDVMSGSDTARECRFVSTGKEMKQNAVNFKRDFLPHAAEEILRFKVNDQVQARVGGRQEMDGGREPQEKSTANSWREKSLANSRRKGQEEAHRRPLVKESGEKLERRRAGASSIVTRDRRESCEEAAVLKTVQVVNSQSGEVVITVPTVGFSDARTRVPSCGMWEARPDL